MGEDLASKFGLNYFETSAKMNMGIKECMNDIFEQTISYKFKLNQLADDRKSIVLNGNNHNQAGKNRKSNANGEPKKGCC